MKLVCCDFETLWSSKDYTLSKMGPIQYIRDGRFSAQLLGWRVNREPVQVCEHDDIPAVLASLHLDAPDTITVAHNGNGFDFLIFSEIYGVVPSHTLDTIDMMRWCGLSSIINESHASLTAHFGTGVKRQGTVISDGKNWPQDFTPEEREAFKLYCMQDVEQCSENCFRMLPFITSDMLTFDTITSHMAMEPAIWADGDALREYDAALTAQTVKARSDLQHLFHFDTVEEFQKNIRSAQKFCVMLRQLGVEPPVKVSEAKSKTKKAEMEAAGLDTSDPESWTVYTPALSKQDREFVELQEHPDERVALLVRTRLENNSSIQQSRTRTFIRMADYHRPVPVMLKAFGAHTGRYAAGNTEGKSDSLNWQNLSKRNSAMLPLRKALRVPKGYKLVSCDSSQVEARCNAYICQELPLLEQFENRQDPYSILAESFGFGPTAQEIHEGAKHGDKYLKGLRNAGKTGILSCFSGETKVLSSRGWVPIKSITLEDKLWDGQNWVNHQGLISNGKRQTILMDGVRVTPNHLIFDGSSWRKAIECCESTSLLNSALSYGSDALKTCALHSMGRNMVSSICASAYNAEVRNGFPELRFYKLGDAASTALHVLKDTLLTPVIFLGSLHLFPQSVVDGLVLNTSICGGCSSVVAGLMTGEKYQVLPVVQLRHVELARKNVGVSLYQKIYQPTKIYVQMQSIGAGYITEYMQWSDVATVQPLPIMNAMAVAALSFVSKTSMSVCSILSRFRDGIIHLWRLIESTMLYIMNGGTCGLYRGAPMHIINAPSRTTNSFLESSMTELENSKQSVPVYDILNAGPNHSYVIKTNSGALLVHNCGYGVGWQKYANTLWQQNIRLGNSYDKHCELAKHAHNIYRMSNPAIVQFWRRCQQIIEALAGGGEGRFGGPNDDLFWYGSVVLAGCTTPIPSIISPAGYGLRYPGLHAEIGDSGKIEYKYTIRRGRSDIPHRLYGGALDENIIQHIAFMLLMWEACRMYEAGIKLVCNIHDSFSTVVPEAEAEATADLMVRIMRTLPPWLPGCPIDAEAEITDDFTGA